MEQRARSSSVKTTHIHDLPDLCLVQVLSLVGNAPLPIRRPVYRDIRIYHPLQCALVCKRWRLCARASVRSLLLNSSDLEEALASQAVHFTALQWLRLGNRLWYTQPEFLAQIASVTPTLKRLDLTMDGRHCSDVSSALCSWTCIKELGLTNPFSHPIPVDLQASLLSVLATITSIENLDVGPGLFKDAVVWEKLCPHMPHLKKLACAEPPSPFMPSIPSLALTLNSLPPHVLQLRGLVKLHLNGPSEFELPTELGSMASLESLTLKNCALRAMPSSIGQLRALKFILISRCKSLQELPESIGNLSSLEVLHLYFCDGLRRLPDSLALLTGVEDLEVTIDRQANGKRLRALPEGLGAMQGLANLRLQGARLQAIPEGLGELRLLTQLSLIRLSNLKELPTSLGSLGSLRRMRLHRLYDVEGLPDSLGQLTRLESIDIAHCGLQSLPETLGQLSALTELTLMSCHKFELPSSVGGLISLIALRIEECGIEELPEGLAELANLREVVVRNCAEFSDKMGVIPRMKGLRFLHLAGCKPQYFLPGGLDRLDSLRLIRCARGMVERASSVNHYPSRLMDIMEIDWTANNVWGENNVWGGKNMWGDGAIIFDVVPALQL